MEMKFDGYGARADFLKVKEGKLPDFNDKQGGDIDAFGDWEKCEKDSANMNAGKAFNEKDYTKVEAMGTDYPTKTAKQIGSRTSDAAKLDGDHFDVDYHVEPYGTEEKNDFGQSRRADQKNMK